MAADQPAAHRRERRPDQAAPDRRSCCPGVCPCRGRVNMKLVRPPYRLGSSDNHPALSPAVLELNWLGPPQVTEAHPWTMLSLGGTPSVSLPDHIVEAA